MCHYSAVHAIWDSSSSDYSKNLIYIIRVGYFLVGNFNITSNLEFFTIETECNSYKTFFQIFIYLVGHSDFWGLISSAVDSYTTWVPSKNYSGF